MGCCVEVEFQDERIEFCMPSGDLCSWELLHFWFGCCVERELQDEFIEFTMLSAHGELDNKQDHDKLHFKQDDDQLDNKQHYDKLHFKRDYDQLDIKEDHD